MAATRRKHPRLARPLGQRIAAARKEAGLTQEGLAEKLGIYSVTLSRIERGETLPSLPLLFDLANKLDTRLSALLPGSAESPAELAQTISGWLQRLTEEQRLFATRQLKQTCDYLAGAKKN